MENVKKLSIPLILVIIAVGLVIGNAGYTFQYAKGWSYLSDDPAACKNCHVMNQVYENWMKGGHQNVATCNDCHVPHDFVGKWLMKAQSGLGHGYAFTFKDNPVAFTANAKSKQVTQDNCLRCHNDYASNAVDSRAMSKTALGDKKIVEHMNTSSEPLKCISCHRQVGHAHNF